MFGGKRKRGKKVADIDKMVSYKPFSIITQDQEEEDEKEFPPIPDEQEYIESSQVKFYDHQIQAIRWMYHIEAKKKESDKHVGGILGDVMGLGKTISSLGLICYDILRAKKNGLEKPLNPTLIVAPLTLMDHWQSEATILFKLAEEDVMIYHGTFRYEQLQTAIEKGNRPTVIITTYETVQKDYSKKAQSPLYNLKWIRVFLDEAHIARNPKTKTFRALKHFDTRAVWCVTGTPIVNYPDDVRMLSILCTPSNPLDYTSALQEMVWKKNHLLRRTKEMLDLPSITYKEEWVDMSPEEFEQYRKLEFWAQTQYDQLVQSDTLTQQYQKILLVLVRLRQGCDHFQLQDGHDVTSKILELTKKELGLPLEPYPVFKEEEHEEDTLSGEDLNASVEFGDNTCFIESDVQTKKRKRKEEKQKKLLKKQKTVDLQHTIQKDTDTIQQVNTEDTIQQVNTEDTTQQVNIEDTTQQVNIEDEVQSDQPKKKNDCQSSEDDAEDKFKKDNQSSEDDTDTKSTNRKRKLLDISDPEYIDDKIPKVCQEDDCIFEAVDAPSDEPLNLSTNIPIDKHSDDEKELILDNATKSDIKTAINQLSKLKKKKKNLDNVNVNFDYSTKMRHLLKILEENKIPDPDGKTVVFSQFTTMLDLIECMLLRKGYKVARFDGRQQKSEVRKNIIKIFRTNPECTVLLASLKAGGVGLNLLPARYLVLMDPWWNNSIEYQAFDRIHRIGQKCPVTVYKILINRTIEEEVLKIQKKKQNQEASFFDDEKKQILSVRDIHCVFTTMKTRQMKMMRLINTN